MITEARALCTLDRHLPTYELQGIAVNDVIRRFGVSVHQLNQMSCDDTQCVFEVYDYEGGSYIATCDLCGYCSLRFNIRPANDGRGAETYHGEGGGLQGYDPAFVPSW